MFTPTEDQIQAEIARIQERFSDMGEHILRRWAVDELRRVWRANREYDHTEVRMEGPQDSFHNPEQPKVLVGAYTMPADSDRGQVWVTRLALAEAHELRDQLNALLDGISK